MGRFSKTILVVCLILLAGCSTGTTPIASNDTQNGATTAWNDSTTPDIPPGSETRVATVTRVIDGDTLEVRYQDGSTDTVRLLGVDTPEVHTSTDPAEFAGISDSEAGREWLRNWGHRASEFVRAEVASEQVRIVTDSQADRRGSYGRLLAYAYHADGLLNRQLLQQGYARLYDSEFSNREQFRADEAVAREQRVGLWNNRGDDAEATTTAEQRGPLTVVQIQADAPGNDHENTNGEYLVFENTEAKSLSLSGWTVSDSADHSYTIPDNVVLESGEQLTLYTGPGTSSNGTLYWGSETAIWNNDGDTVIVRSATGTIVLEQSYSS